MSTEIMEAIMVANKISVWLDPEWWEGSGCPKWLAGQNIRAVEGACYGTMTGCDPSSIEGDNTASGDSPSLAIAGVIALLSKKEKP